MRIFLAFILLVISRYGLAESDRLLPGNQLANNQKIVSPNGKYLLVMQSDGSLVMYRSVNGSVRYRMEKYGSYAIMQTDGNFVEYNSNNSAIWSTNTGGQCSNCWLQIFDDGDLAVHYVNWNGSFGYSVWGIGPDNDYPPVDAEVYPLVEDKPAELNPPAPWVPTPLP